MAIVEKTFRCGPTLHYDDADWFEKNTPDSELLEWVVEWKKYRDIMFECIESLKNTGPSCLVIPEGIIDECILLFEFSLFYKTHLKNFVNKSLTCLFNSRIQKFF